MHPTITSQIIAQRIAERQQQADKHRLVRQLRFAGAARPPNGRVRADWVRLSFRRSRPTVA